MNCYHCKLNQQHISSLKTICNLQNIANKFYNQFMNNCSNLIGKGLYKHPLSECNQFYISCKLRNLNMKNMLNHIFCTLHFLSTHHLNRHWHIGSNKWSYSFYSLQNIAHISFRRLKWIQMNILYINFCNYITNNLLDIWRKIYFGLSNRLHIWYKLMMQCCTQYILYLNKECI